MKDKLLAKLSENHLKCDHDERNKEPNFEEMDQEFDDRFRAYLMDVQEGEADRRYSEDRILEMRVMTKYLLNDRKTA